MSGGAADHHRARHRLAALLVFEPMRVDAGAQFDRRIHAEPARRFDLAAIIADVLQAAVRVFGDVMAGGQIRRVVETRRRDRHRQPVEAAARLVEIAAGDADFLAWRLRDHARLKRRGERFHPGIADLVERPAEADAIDFGIGGKPRDQHGYIVMRALAVGRLREQKCLAIGLRRCRRDIASAPADAFRYLC